MALISIMHMSAQISKHGIVLNGGTGKINSTIDKTDAIREYITYKFGASLGYRLRFKTPVPKSFHYDLDANLGVKSLEELSERWGGGYLINGYFSVGGTANYSLIKNVSAGLGFEPAYCFGNGSNFSKSNFDIPVVAKIAYNLKFVEIGISGKYGLVNVFEASHLKSGKFREIQLSAFIPFSF